MKKIIVVMAIVLFSITAWAQENSFTLSGGYAFANIEDNDTGVTGWRLNGLYEFNPAGGNFVHGFSFGYIGTSGESDGVSQSTTEYKINTWPIYYAPKFLIGKGSAKGFIKGALGAQTTTFKRTGSFGELKDADIGFYGGAGAGFMKTFNEKMFITVEYEWAYLSNSAYKDGFMNSAMLGIGMKF
ncbi:MAG: outer membrane beta-barrel protein [Cyclobacteriaceae bacterium]|nr:outer membrane beta-barrel protein [Cyclobacteriaceae bacterium]